MNNNLMSKKKLLFIGGSSFIGSHIADQYSKTKIIYNISKKNNLSSAHYNYKFDLNDYKFVKKI